jgi:hypothetical protein
VPIGKTSEYKIFEVTNSGGSELIVNSVTLSGFNPGRFYLTIPDLPLILDIDDSAEFKVSFSPTSIGVVSARLEILHNALDSQTNVSLSGNGHPMSDYDLVIAYTKLIGNFPNPFNPETTIRFDLASSGYISLGIFNIYGQRVRLLLDGFMGAGRHSIVWDGTDDNQRRVSSGIYFYRMQTEEYSSMRRMLLLK